MLDCVLERIYDSLLDVADADLDFWSRSESFGIVDEQQDESRPQKVLLAYT